MKDNIRKLEFIPNNGTRDILLSLVKSKKITINNLNKITKIDIKWLETYLNCEENTLPLSLEQSTYLAQIAMFLTSGFSLISEDDRIKGIINILIDYFDFTYELIAIYAKIDQSIIRSFMEDSEKICLEDKYKLAVTIMMMHYLFKYPNYENTCK